MKKTAAPSLRDAIKTVTDLKDDFLSAPPEGFRLSQDDCHLCGVAMIELLRSHNAFMEDMIAWQETREGMNR